MMSLVPDPSNAFLVTAHVTGMAMAHVTRVAATVYISPPHAGVERSSSP